jgi:hypothetical protein
VLFGNEYRKNDGERTSLALLLAMKGRAEKESQKRAAVSQQVPGAPLKPPDGGGAVLSHTLTPAEQGGQSAFRHKGLPSKPSLILLGSCYYPPYQRPLASPPPTSLDGTSVLDGEIAADLHHPGNLLLFSQLTSPPVQRVSWAFFSRQEPDKERYIPRANAKQKKRCDLTMRPRTQPR